MNKLQAVVTRRKSTDFGTPGELQVYMGDLVPVFTCDTLEKQWAGNKSGVSCTKADTYLCKRVFSEHFGKQIWRLEDKHGRVACEIHNGNFAGNESLGYETQVHGCTLVGRGYAQVERNDGKKPSPQYGIINSKVTLLALMVATKDADELEILYQWADGCAPEDDK